MSRVIVTKELAREGLSVMRGRDWRYANQDVRSGNKGKIIRIGSGSDGQCPDGWVRVKWEGGEEHSYKVGYNNSYDLYVYVSSGIESIEESIMFKKGNLVKLKPVSPYSLNRQKVYKVSDVGWSVIGLEGELGAFEMKYFELTQDVEKKILAVSRFKAGDEAFVRNPDSYWVKQAELIEDVAYRVYAVHTPGSRAVKMSASGFWVSDEDLMTREEWLRTPKKTPHSQIDKLRTGLSEIETKSNFKPNTNTNNEHRRNNNNPSTAIKVRRASWVIKGPEKRTRTFF